jgi:hypothetical protein
MTNVVEALNCLKTCIPEEWANLRPVLDSVHLALCKIPVSTAPIFNSPSIFFEELKDSSRKLNKLEPIGFQMPPPQNHTSQKLHKSKYVHI